MKKFSQFLLLSIFALSLCTTGIYAQQDGTTIRDKGNKPPLKAKAMKAKKKMNSQKEYSTKKVALLSQQDFSPKFMNRYEKMMFDLVVRDKEEQKVYWLDVLARLEAKGHISPNSPLKEVANWNLGENSGYSKDRKDKMIRVLAGDKFTKLENAIAQAFVDIEDIPQEEYDQQASTGEDVGGAAGTVVGAIAGFIAGGALGAIAGAKIGEELGKMVGKAMGILINAISGKNGNGNGGKGGDDKDNGGGKDDDTDTGDGGDVEPEPTGVEAVDNPGDK